MGPIAGDLSALCGLLAHPLLQQDTSKLKLVESGLIESPLKSVIFFNFPIARQEIILNLNRVDDKRRNQTFHVSTCPRGNQINQMKRKFLYFSFFFILKTNKQQLMNKNIVFRFELEFHDYVLLLT